MSPLEKPVDPARPSLFAIDLRSLALFRVGLASLLLTNLAMRWPTIALILTDSGILPRDLREALTAHLDVPCLPPSIHVLTGSETGVKALFIVAASLALALLVGYRTRLASIGCWILTLGLYSRNPITVDGGDCLLLLLSFWSMFVPLGAVASFDARAGRGAPHGVTSVMSAGTAGLLLQGAYLYIFAGMEKWGAEWELGGHALCHMFVLDLFVRPPGRLLASLHPWLHVLPPLVTWGELIGGMLFFSPCRTIQTRLLLIGAFALLQASFLLTIQVTLFPFVSILATVPFLPGAFWRAMGPRSQPTNGPVALGDANSLEKVVARFFILLMTLINLSFISWLPFDLPLAFDRFIQTTGIYQQWNMFSPSPPTIDGWPILEARLEDGRIVDLYTGALASRQKPAVVIDRFRTFRESMLIFKLIRNPWTLPLARHYLVFKIDEWNREHSTGPRVRSARLIIMYEPTLLDCREGLARPWIMSTLEGEASYPGDQGPAAAQPGSRQGSPR